MLGQCDDDALGAADVTEPIAVLVLRQLANEFGAVGVQVDKDVLNVCLAICRASAAREDLTRVVERPVDWHREPDPDVA